MFSPDTFLNAYKLYSAQQLKVSVDDLVLHTTFDKNSATGKVNPLKIRGLLLQGCSFVDKKLSEKENTASKAEYEVLPVCYMLFRPRDTATSETDTIALPLFTNLSREKQIVEVNLPYSGNKSTLIIRGSALAINP